MQIDAMQMHMPCMRRAHAVHVPCTCYDVYLVEHSVQVYELLHRRACSGSGWGLGFRLRVRVRVRARR